MEFVELENQFLKIGVAVDGSAMVLRGHGQSYESGPVASACYGGMIPLDLPSFGKVAVRREQRELVITVKEIVWYARFPGHGYRKPDPGPDLRFTFRIRLEEEEAVFITDVPENLDDELLSVQFPKGLANWNTAKSGHLAGTFSGLGSRTARSMSSAPMPFCRLPDISMRKEASESIIADSSIALS